jgi:predicted nucleic acid-binding protein
MKYIPKLFLETSVFNYYNYGKEGKKQQDTRKLFEDIKQGKYRAYTSALVTDEIKAASEKKRDQMMELVERYRIVMVPDNPHVKPLADIYMAKKIIPAKSWKDARHIAETTINELDCIVSFDGEHIVKPKTMVGVGFINLDEGYKWLGIATPTEVVDYVNA